MEWNDRDEGDELPSTPRPDWRGNDPGTPITRRVGGSRTWPLTATQGVTEAKQVEQSSVRGAPANSR
jgi:hypothetical protein